MFESRLPLRRWTRFRSLSTAVLLLLTACGGKEFTTQSGGTGGATSGGSGGMGGSTSSGGSAGTSSGGQAGSAGSSGSSGSGGTMGSCNCEAGQYCRGGKCRDCGDFSSLEFGAPERLEGPAQNDEGNVRFPRAGEDETSLFYSTDHLYYTSDFTSDQGTHVSAMAAPLEEAPLYIDSPGSLNFNLLFTRMVGDVLPTKDILTADWTGTTFMTVKPAVAPLNLDPADDYSVALATASARFWWMSTRNGEAQLLTAVQGDALAVLVEPQVQGPNAIACHAVGDDLTPWVSEQGDLLFFSAQVVDAACNVLDNGATDIYVALLDNDGQPVQSGIPLSDVNIGDQESSEVSPSLSADSCWLYFASDGGAGSPMQIYRAPRR